MFTNPILTSFISEVNVSDGIIFHIYRLMVALKSSARRRLFVCTQIKKWKARLDVWYRGSFTIVSKGIVTDLRGMNCASDFSVPLHRLQQEFRVTHPAASTLSCLVLTSSGMCSFCRYHATVSPTHAATPLAYLPKFVPFYWCFLWCTLFLFVFKPFFFPCRIRNWGLVLPYQEAKTSPVQTLGTQLWWCQMCCQMDQPVDDYCKSTTGPNNASLFTEHMITCLH